MRRRLRLQTLAAFALGPTLAVTACGSAGNQSDSGGGQNGHFDAASYFAGKTINVITSSSAGGGTDAKARVIAKYFGKFIPGHPRLKVSNVTPHVAGMNYEWAGSSDGTLIGVESNSLLEFELFQGAKWNAAKFNYIGSINSACPSVMMVRGNTGYKTLKSTEGANSPALTTIMQAPNPASMEPYDISTMLLAKWLHQPLKVKRVADSGTSALNLAMQRGDINYARYGADWCRFPQAHPGWLKHQYLVPILDVNADGAGTEPQVIQTMKTNPPYVKDVLSKTQFKKWQAIVAAPREGGSPLFLPPGTPANITKALRTAYHKMATNPQFQKAIGKAFGENGHDLTYMPGSKYQHLQTANRRLLYHYKDKLHSLRKSLYATYLH